MVAKFPTGCVRPRPIPKTAVVIFDDNTIAILHHDHDYDYWLTIYQYDGSESWHITEKFDLEFQGGPMDRTPSLAVHGDILVVGVPDTYDYGRVNIFNRVGGEWYQAQTIEQHGFESFGWSVTIHGPIMAVSAFQGFVFTYRLDEDTNTWVNNGRLSVPSEWISSLHLHMDIGNNCQ